MQGKSTEFQSGKEKKSLWELAQLPGFYFPVQFSNKPFSDTKDINLLGNQNESLFIIYKSPYFVVL